uniref:Leucine-rich repeat receptor-like serine/threonine/tyrosine-protein kinase SOBIR1 n=1 Tax=Rhizophora mucronata TaxID=61149 RepID=A0A2P2PML5_RHIMU
MLEMGAQKR